jgi:F0F1-type ATP synthase membrane subunit b/b'
MLSLDANVIVVFLIVWVLVLVLSNLFFKPVRRVRDGRNRAILETRKSGEKAQDSYDQSVREIETALKRAKATAESARQALSDEALKEKARMISAVGAECKAQVETARADLDRTVRKLKEKLESEASDLAERIEKKLLP